MIGHWYCGKVFYIIWTRIHTSDIHGAYKTYIPESMLKNNCHFCNVMTVKADHIIYSFKEAKWESVHPIASCLGVEKKLLLGE